MIRPRRSGRLAFAGVALALLFATVGATALQKHTTFAGKVVAVQDGDWLSVVRDGRAERVRIHGIDAPESGQDFGNRAKQFLSALVFGKVVEVEVRDIDRYGRSVGRVLVEGRDVGLEVVRAGFAWHFTRYSNDTGLAAAEREARAAKRGLWAQTGAVPPWEHRVGSPQSPTPEQYERLERAGQLTPAAAPAPLDVVSSRATVRLTLPRQAVALLVIEW